MAWPTTRHKTAANGGSWSFDDMNAVQDQILDATGFQLEGASVIATEQSRSNTAYGTLTTPDQVTNVVLPTDGLIVVRAHAHIKSSVNAAGSMGLFLGSNLVQNWKANLAAEVSTTGTNLYWPAATGRASSVILALAGGDHSDVTTGMVVDSGSGIFIFAAAATYTVSLQFKATSGSVTAKDRKLYVWTATP